MAMASNHPVVAMDNSLVVRVAVMVERVVEAHPVAMAHSLVGTAVVVVVKAEEAMVEDSQVAMVEDSPGDMEVAAEGVVVAMVVDSQVDTVVTVVVIVVGIVVAMEEEVRAGCLVMVRAGHIFSLFSVHSSNSIKGKIHQY